MDGKSCLLRAICEMHESPLVGYGLVGELLEIFLTWDLHLFFSNLFFLLHIKHFRPSRSPYWNRMAEYISAEQSGKKHGDCQKFEKDCSRSLFKLNKYSWVAASNNASQVFIFPSYFTGRQPSLSSQRSSSSWRTFWTLISRIKFIMTLCRDTFVEVFHWHRIRKTRCKKRKKHEKSSLVSSKESLVRKCSRNKPTRTLARKFPPITGYLLKTLHINGYLLKQIKNSLDLQFVPVVIVT